MSEFAFAPAGLPRHRVTVARLLSLDLVSWRHPLAQSLSLFLTHPFFAVSQLHGKPHTSWRWVFVCQNQAILRAYSPPARVFRL